MEAVADTSKVAAVFAGDEHAYHRIKINNETPVGVMSNDKNGDGVLKFSENWMDEQTETCSANPDFKYPTWQITAGNAGAPWYNKQYNKIPWADDLESSLLPILTLWRLSCYEFRSEGAQVVFGLIVANRQNLKFVNFL